MSKSLILKAFIRKNRPLKMEEMSVLSVDTQAPILKYRFYIYLMFDFISLNNFFLLYIKYTNQVR